MRNLISYEEFLAAVGDDVLQIILECCHQGFADSVEMINYGNQLGIPVEYETRTKAGIAHDHMKARFRQALGNIAGIEMGKWNGIFALKFGEEAFCRIKKLLNGTPFVSVALTRQQRRFNNQLPISGFPEKPTYITIGYYADRPWTALLGVWASCWSADGLEWFQKIGGEGFAQLRLFDDQTPVAPRITPMEIEVERPKRVRGKNNPKKNTGTDDPTLHH
jgi:hypothetical protein